MQENPLWPVEERFPKLQENIGVDVAVVGGGIAGISCGYFLSEAGYKTVVLEEDEVGCAASGASSGILYYGSGTNFVEAVELYGRERATVLWKESAESIETIEKVVDRYGIECGFRRPGAVMVAKTPREVESLQREREGLGAMGIDCRLLEAKEIKSYFRLQEFLAGLEFEICGQIHPAQFAAGLAKASGLPVYEHTPMTNFKGGKEGITVEAPNARVECSHLVIATNLKPIFGLEENFQVESSTIIASPPLPHDRLKDIWPAEKLIWTMEEQYDIIYPQEGRLVLEVYQVKGVEEKLAYYFPGFNFTIDLQWGDSWSKSRDWLPVLGPVRHNIYVAVAMGDQGVVMGFTSGRKMIPCIGGRHDEFLSMVSPSRLGRSPK